MKTIYKYPIKAERYQSVSVPGLLRVLSVDLDARGNPCVWVLRDTDDEKVTALGVHVLATGEPIREVDPAAFVDTFVLHQDGLVFHAFVAKEE